MILISETECLEILKNDNNKYFKLISYRTEIVSQKSIGFLGEYYILIVKIKNENDLCKTLQFFIKSLPIQNEIERKRIESYGIFEKEGALYKLFEKFPTCLNDDEKWRPKCFYTRSDIIVLEHLLNSNYYHETEFQVTFNHMKAVLNNLAKLHASSIGFEIENSIIIGDQYEEILFKTSISKDIEWFNVGLEAVQTVLMLHPKYQSTEHQIFMKNNFFSKIEPIYDMVKRSNEFRNVLCHRDLWGNNIYFKRLNNNNNSVVDDDNNDNLSSVLIDFQTCCYCPPAIDVLFFIYLNTRRSFRDGIFNQCLEWYYKQLVNNLKLLNVNSSEIISFNDFIKSCNKFKLASVVYNCITGTIIRLPHNYLRNLKRTDPEKYENYMNKTRISVIKKLLSENSEFAEFMYEVTQELMELIYN